MSAVSSGGSSVVKSLEDSPMTDAPDWFRKTRHSLAEKLGSLRLVLEGWREHARLRQELATLEQRGELDRTLIDTGIAPSDVPRLLRAHPHTPEQLRRMMRRVGLDRATLPHTPAVVERLRAIEWRCGECTNWRRCHAWLAADETPEGYRRFCPNAEAFDELRHLLTPPARGLLAELAETHGEELGR
jgi:uncharacterized protein YjiS (DUF1127 family)